MSFKAAVEKTEDFALGWLAYGLAAAELGEWRNARHCFKRCIRTFDRKGKGLDVLWYKIFQGRESHLLGLGEGWVLERTRVSWNFNKTYHEKGSVKLKINARIAEKARQIRAGLNGIPAGVYMGPGWDAVVSVLDLEESERVGGRVEFLVSPALSRPARHSRSLPVLPSARGTPVRSWVEGDDSPESEKFNARRLTVVEDDYDPDSEGFNALRLSSVHAGDSPDSSMHDTFRPSCIAGDDSPDSMVHDAFRLSLVEDDDIFGFSMHDAPCPPRADWRDGPDPIINGTPGPPHAQKGRRPSSSKQHTDQYGRTKTDVLIPNINPRNESPDFVMHDKLRPCLVEDDNSPNTTIYDIARLSVAWTDDHDSLSSVTTAVPSPLRPHRDKDRTPTSPKQHPDQYRNTTSDLMEPSISQDFATCDTPRLSWVEAPNTPYPVLSALPSPLRPHTSRVPTWWENQPESPTSETDSMPDLPPAYAVRSSMTPGDPKRYSHSDFLTPIMAPRKGVDSPLSTYFAALPRQSRAINYGGFAGFDGGVALWRLQQYSIGEDAGMGRMDVPFDKRIRDSWIEDGQMKEGQKVDEPNETPHTEKEHPMTLHEKGSQSQRMSYLRNVMRKDHVESMNRIGYIENTADEETTIKDEDFEIPFLQPTVYEGWPHGRRKGTRRK